ncbi:MULTISPECIES: thioredoxin family protein [unclassified Streptomyces]|uniref:thioredoxin family protein n=1 Tax=unclassified Streptomyces TaxID=2593676 RepID=UPI002E2EC326|nr:MULTISPECIES: thioredoxin family protein [unclassified Streptomyces]WUC63061.1 thioredoxin family protein [Streptomyces sp. NBC_00539]
MLRPVRTERRTAASRSAAPAGTRLPLVAAAVVAAGLTAACGPATPPVGAGAPSTAASSVQSPPSATASATASPEASPTASASPSASATVRAASPTARAGSAAAAGGAASAKPSRDATAAAPAAPAAPVPGPGYDSSADAQKQIDAALRAAKADGRTVLLDFGANWCGNCKAADKVFGQSQTAAILGASYHLVKVDIGGNSSANSALLRKYSPSGGTYTMPVLVVVSPSGTVRTDTHVTGNPSLTSDGINSFLRKWAP